MVPAKTLFIASAAAPQLPDPRVYLIFPGAARAKAALGSAVAYVRGLDLQIELIVPYVVPFALPLNEPPVSSDFMERAMSQLAAGVDAAVSVRILLCRDSDDAVRQAVGRDSLVMIPAGRSKLARLLAADGHRLVVFP